MLDPYVRPLIDPPLDRISHSIAVRGISADSVTLTGFAFGICAMVAIGFEHYFLGLGFILLNRLFDGLDGGVARHNGITDFGGFLDILCDFIIYSGIVFAFTLANPEEAFWGAFLIFSFIGPITSFLAYAIIAAKKTKTSEKRGKKSFYYLGGICEGTETFMVLVLICIIPDDFPLIALGFGVLCWITTFGRGLAAWHDFK